MYKHFFSFVLLLVFAIPVFCQNAQTIHVMVALCDNKYQGIVKVPKAIGNGQDPNNNLYWGCGYGVRTFFKKQVEWKEIKRYKANGVILERIVFKHKTKDYYLVADAYDGEYIKECTTDFLSACAGKLKDTLQINNIVVGIRGNAKLLAYIGHNGLMDFTLTNSYRNTDKKKRDAIILACASKQYFAPFVRSAEVNPILWSTHLMAPEAYVLSAAVSSYINNEGGEAIRNSAANAYSKYQKCGLKAAKRLLVTGF